MFIPLYTLAGFYINLSPYIYFSSFSESDFSSYTVYRTTRSLSTTVSYVMYDHLESFCIKEKKTMTRCSTMFFFGFD